MYLWKPEVISEIKEKEIWKKIWWILKDWSTLWVDWTVTDINKDGLDDVVSLKEIGWSNQLKIYLNKNWTYIEILNENNVDSKVFIDFNKDWYKDLIIKKKDSITIYKFDKSQNKYLKINENIYWELFNFQDVWWKELSLFVKKWNNQDIYFYRNWKYIKVLSFVWKIDVKDINNDWIKDFIVAENIWKNAKWVLYSYNFYTLNKNNKVFKLIDWTVIWNSYYVLSSLNYMNNWKWNNVIVIKNWLKNYYYFKDLNWDKYSLWFSSKKSSPEITYISKDKYIKFIDNYVFIPFYLIWKTKQRYLKLNWNVIKHDKNYNLIWNSVFEYDNNYVFPLWNQNYLILNKKNKNSKIIKTNVTTKNYWLFKTLVVDWKEIQYPISNDLINKLKKDHLLWIVWKIVKDKKFYDWYKISITNLKNVLVTKNVSDYLLSKISHKITHPTTRSRYTELYNVYFNWKKIWDWSLRHVSLYHWDESFKITDINYYQLKLINPSWKNISKVSKISVNWKITLGGHTDWGRWPQFRTKLIKFSDEIFNNLNKLENIKSLNDLLKWKKINWFISKDIVKIQKNYKVQTNEILSKLENLYWFYWLKSRSWIKWNSLDLWSIDENKITSKRWRKRRW